jgi:AraC-like DNA-binding protein
MPPLVATRRYQASTASHRHDFVQVLFCIEGEMDLDVEGHANRLSPMTGYVIPVGARHDFAGRGGNACVVLDLPLPEAGNAAGQLERGRELRVAPRDWPLMRYLALELVRAPHDALLQEAAPPMLLRLLATEPAPATGGRALPLAALTDYIDMRLMRGIDNAELAARCFLSTGQFQARFLADVGCTPQSYVRRRRLDRALSLLEEGLPVAVVAAAVGYASPSALTAALRRERGVTPRRWRQRIRPG